MLRILRDKFLRLGRDEDGVALVTTLAVFMFMYLFCIGVYAIGTAVKTRIHLQNACDAAAYSAAVVQADTFSRIATINRAMSWTYIQMTRRQMDYIMNRWLKHVVSHYEQDHAALAIWALTGTLCPEHTGWDITDIDINGSRTVSVGTVESRYSGFSSHLRSYSDSFYAASASESGLQTQIRRDKETISEMNSAIDDLMQELPRREDKVIKNVLEANLTDSMRANCKLFKKRSDTPKSDYFTELKNSSDDEARFFWFGGYWGGRKTIRRTSDGTGDISPSHAEDVFEDGVDTWLRRGNEIMDAFSYENGLQRSYRRFEKDHKLYAKWKWWSTKSVCVLTPDGWVHVPPGVPLTTCAHLIPPSCLLDDHCSFYDSRIVGKIKTRYQAKVHANIIALWTDEYVGEKCHPVVLKKDYFEKYGTITVGLARHNENPWVSVLRSITGGIFTAFNPFVEWTVCLASAKAGYKFIGDDMDNKERAYRIDWKSGSWYTQNQSWNLCQSDWDAVLIPVRRAETLAADESWDGDVGNFLNGYLNGIAPSSEMRAGGNDDLSAYLDKRDYGEEYLWGVHNHHKHSYRDDMVYNFWNGSQLPLHRPPDGVNVRAKWQIGNPNNPINWDGLQKVMFH